MIGSTFVYLPITARLTIVLRNENKENVKPIFNIIELNAQEEHPVFTPER